jgi:A/G-specific adenine glycosylase
MKTTGRQAVPKHGDLNKLPADLLAWFDRHGRDLPWRTALGERRDPYRVWLAEIMLQQTTIPHGTPYFHAFTKRWPTVEALAAAKDEDVMAAWAGLGYYARARNLLKCAREISARGSWPETAEALKKLPGIGPYTAGAIAAIAFNQPAAAVDGNVDRVFARLLALKGDWARRRSASIRKWNGSYRKAVRGTLPKR